MTRGKGHVMDLIDMPTRVVKHLLDAAEKVTGGFDAECFCRIACAVSIGLFFRLSSLLSLFVATV